MERKILTMSELIRANLGDMSKGRYFEKTVDKKQSFYVSVVSTKRVFDEQEQKWTDGQQRWYDAKFDGADADWVRDTLQNGDSLLLFGTTRDKEREVDGVKYPSTALFVDAVSLNPHLSRFTIDRTPRQERTRDATQSASRQAEQTGSLDSEPALAARAEINARLGHVFEQKHIERSTGDAVMDAWDAAGGNPVQAKAAIQGIFERAGTSPAVSLYVSSVVDEYAGTGHALGWNEAALAAAPAPAQEGLWAQVNEIKHDLATTSPRGPGM